MTNEEITQKIKELKDALYDPDVRGDREAIREILKNIETLEDQLVQE